MQNDLRQTGQKQYICMRKNMHKLRPEIVDYSVWKASYNYKDQRAHQFCAISGGSSSPGLPDADHAKIPNICKKDQTNHHFCAISGGSSCPGLSDGSTLVRVLQSAKDQHCQLFWNNLRLFACVAFLQNNGLMSLRYPVFVWLKLVT